MASYRFYIQEGKHITNTPNHRWAFDKLIEMSSGNPFIYASRHLCGDIPLSEGLAAVLTHVTVIEKFRSGTHRMEGIYRHRTASVTLRKTFDKGSWNFEAEGIAEKVPDLEALFTRILAGDIMPNIPFEVKQEARIMRALDHFVAIWRIATSPIMGWCKRLKQKWGQRYHNA
jgi:hypothetical protein